MPFLGGSEELSAGSDQSSSTFPDPTATAESELFEMPCERAKISLGFVDMLGDHDFCNPSSIFDDLLEDIAPPIMPTLRSPATPLPDSSEVATPNSSSISSSPAKGDRRRNETLDDAEQDQEKTEKQQLKPKKKSKKKERKPRFAFMTKSDLDNLDDGYRWRKYGQKAVKNSHFPRSYYRCTSAACSVKKRVERSSDDPSIVVTTYEGTHIHLRPIIRRSSFGIPPEPAAIPGSGEVLSSSFSFHHTTPDAMQHQPYMHNPVLPLSCEFPSSFIRNRPFCHSKPSPASSSMELRDHGLLQDMVPSQIQQEFKEE